MAHTPGCFVPVITAPNTLLCIIYCTKVGIRNFSPHLRNSAILRTSNSVAELRTKKSCGTAIADFQNLTSAIPQLCAVSAQFHYFLVPFPQLRMVLKSNQQYFWNRLFLWKMKTCLKGTVARDFWPPIFFWIDEFGFEFAEIFKF
jgi:hypothetical protein